ncbi:DNA packaging protein [Salmonella phage 41]|nr:DNA packaging protein [Salmonella phage 41]
MLDKTDGTWICLTFAMGSEDISRKAVEDVAAKSFLFHWRAE